MAERIDCPAVSVFQDNAHPNGRRATRKKLGSSATLRAPDPPIPISILIQTGDARRRRFGVATRPETVFERVDQPAAKDVVDHRTPEITDLIPDERIARPVLQRMTFAGPGKEYLLPRFGIAKKRVKNGHGSKEPVCGNVSGIGTNQGPPAPSAPIRPA